MRFIEHSLKPRTDSRWRDTIRKRPSPNGKRPGRRIRVLPPMTPMSGRPTTFLRCFPIPPVASTWAMCASIRSAICWRATSARAASTYCTPWAGTPSACRPRTRPWNRASIPPSGPGATSPPCASSSSLWACPTTGAARSQPAHQTITGTSRRCSSTCSPKTWSTARRPGSIGTPPIIPCLPTSRSLRGVAGARAH